MHDVTLKRGSLLLSSVIVSAPQCQVNVAGTGPAALYSYGLPCTLRVGAEAYRC
jgi:hypothetical protein